MTTNLIAIILLLSGCVDRDSSIDKSRLLGSDYRLFQNTPAWDLARAVKDENSEAILKIGKKNMALIDYEDPIYGQTLLKMSVYNRNFNSAKALIELGADPNKQGKSTRESALMAAAQLGGGGSAHPYADPRYLKLFLQNGGNPNAIQNENGVKRNRTYFTPVLFACLSGIFDYVKILVEAGGDVNSGKEHGFPALFAAIVSGNPDIVMYLLEKGADFKQPMYTTEKGEKKYILDALGVWHFEKDSENYKKQLKIMDFLKQRGF